MRYIKPDVVVVNGNEERQKAPTRMVWGIDASSPFGRQQRCPPPTPDAEDKEAELNALNNGVAGTSRCGRTLGRADHAEGRKSLFW